MHLAFCGHAGTDGVPGCREAPQEPCPVPELLPAGFFHALFQGFILADILLPSQGPGSVQEVIGRPDQQEGHHGALTAAQVQAVVPVRAQAFADSVASDLAGGKIKNFCQMFINRALSAVGIGNQPI